MSVASNNPEFQLALQFVNQTSRSVFLTGKAGTGKTTFLKYIRENSSKKMAVVAPTGVAAINAGGTTLHSFFQLPFGPFVPTVHFGWQGGGDNISDANSLLARIRLNAEKRELFQELELLIIDEISMVRADMLDAVDTILRHVRRQPMLPFGGLQLLYIGDLYQLPPVVIDAERQILNAHYPSPFFFDAQVIRRSPPVYIELQRIYRQKDNVFIGLLNSIRNNNMDWEAFEQLNDRYEPDLITSRRDNYITLTSHNARAEAINQAQISALRGASHCFEATVTGEFNEKAYPAEKTLLLKEGAQVMLIRNDNGETRRYYNGKLGIIQEIAHERLTLSFPDETEELELKRETWKNIRYSYNRERDSVEEEELGTFTQYPIRLAWAITIHKSQGLTFEKAVIDAGASFAPGQVYVALSRLTTLEGLVLLTRITPLSVRTDPRVVAFTEDRPHADATRQLLEREQMAFLFDSLHQAFDWSQLTYRFREYYAEYDRRKIPEREKAHRLARQWMECIAGQQEKANMFTHLLEKELPGAQKDGYQQLQEDMRSAVGSIATALRAQVIDPLKEHIEDHRRQRSPKKYLHQLQMLTALCMRKQQQMEDALQLAAGLRSGADAGDLLAGLEEQRRTSKAAVEQPSGPRTTSPGRPAAAKPAAATSLPAAAKPRKGDSHRLTLQLYKDGLAVEQIAAKRNLALSTIEGHLAAFILTGDIDIKDFVPQHKITLIAAAIQETGASTLTLIRSRLGNGYSFGEIQAVMNYLKLTKAPS